MSLDDAIHHLLTAFIGSSDEVLRLRAEVVRLRAALLAIRQQAYLLGMSAEDWPIVDIEAAIPS